MYFSIAERYIFFHSTVNTFHWYIKITISGFLVTCWWLFSLFCFFHHVHYPMGFYLPIGISSSPLFPCRPPSDIYAFLIPLSFGLLIIYTISSWMSTINQNIFCIINTISILVKKISIKETFFTGWICPAGHALHAANRAFPLWASDSWLSYCLTAL